MIDDVRRTRLFPFCVTRCAEMHSLIGPESFLSDVHAERDQSTQFILRGHFLKISDELVGVPASLSIDCFCKPDFALFAPHAD